MLCLDILSLGCGNQQWQEATDTTSQLSQQPKSCSPQAQDPHRSSPQETAVNLISWPRGWESGPRYVMTEQQKSATQKTKLHFKGFMLHKAASQMYLSASNGNYWKLKLVLRTFWYYWVFIFTFGFITIMNCIPIMVLNLYLNFFCVLSRRLLFPQNVFDSTRIV